LGGVAGGLAAGPAGAFAGAAVGQTIDQLGRGLASLANQAASLQQIRRGLAMASKDAQDFAASEEQVRRSSEKLLLPLEQTYKYFSQLRVNTKQYNISVEETGKIMEGVALAVSSTGGSLEDVDGAMRAVVQIFSKGSVQAEELRGQLGERFPGAVVKFAQANEMSFSELQDALKKGEVGIKEFVEFAKKNYDDYAAFSDQLATAPEYAGRRLALAFEEMQRAIGDALTPAGAIIQDFLTRAINGITNFYNENKEFLTEYATIWAKAFTKVATVLGKFVKYLMQVGANIAKFFKNLTFGIRNMFNLVSVAEVKAQIEKLDAQILATSDRRAKRRLEQRRTALRERFAGLGGEAALSSLDGADNFTFGGAGAGLDLSALTGGGEGGASKRAKELRDFTTNLEEIYRAQFESRKNAIEQDANLTRRQKDIQIAQELFNAEHASAVFRSHQALAEADQYRLDKRKEYVDAVNQTFENERRAAEERYSRTITDPMIKAIEQERQALAELESQMQAIKEGKEELTALDKAEAFIKEQLNGLNEQAIPHLQELGNTLRELAKQRDANNQKMNEEVRLKEKLQVFQEAEANLMNRLSMAGALTPGQEIRERIRQQLGEAATPERIERLAGLEETAIRMEEFKGAVQGVRDEFAGLFSTMINGSASAQESLKQSFANIGKSFADMAGRMIAQWLFMKAIGLVGNLFGGGTPATDPGFVQNQNQISQYMANGGVLTGGFQAFANGGVVNGPTLGLVGEGRYNEAIVPLPDGKSIPVELGGDAKNIVSNITVNVSNGQARSEGNGGANDLGRKLEGAVKQVIIEELRPGGVLAGKR